MTVLVILAAAAASASFLRFFFSPKRAEAATLEMNVQRATVVVAGGYSPDLIHARQGIPLRPTFDRRESVVAQRPQDRGPVTVRRSPLAAIREAAATQ